MFSGASCHKVAGAFLAALLLASPAVAQQDYYKDKTLRFVVGYSPGGGFDIYTRAIAPHQ